MLSGLGYSDSPGEQIGGVNTTQNCGCKQAKENMGAIIKREEDSEQMNN